MTALILQAFAWPTLGLALFVFGLAPGIALRLIVLLYPRSSDRRKELIGELYHVPRIERPFWVAEQLEVAFFEGLPERFSAWRNKKSASRLKKAANSKSRTISKRPAAYTPLVNTAPNSTDVAVDSDTYIDNEDERKARKGIEIWEHHTKDNPNAYADLWSSSIWDDFVNEHRAVWLNSKDKKIREKGTAIIASIY